VLVNFVGTYMGHEAGGLDLWPHGGDINFGRDGSNWIHIGVGSLGLMDGSVGAMTASGEDVWVGTSGGLHRFRGASLQERCPTRDRDTPGDPARKVNALVVDRQGGLWVGTDTGLLYLPRGGDCDGGGGEFTVFTDENSPLPDNRVLAAAGNPRDGSLWFGTSEGLLRVAPLVFSGSAPPDEFTLYPNPIRLDRGESVVFGIAIAGSPASPVDQDLTDKPEVFDITGQKVGEFEMNNTLEGGGWSWDGENLNGDHVAPGIYIVRAGMTSGEVVILRLGVIW